MKMRMHFKTKWKDNLIRMMSRMIRTTYKLKNPLTYYETIPPYLMKESRLGVNFMILRYQQMKKKIMRQNKPKSDRLQYSNKFHLNRSHICYQYPQ